MHRDIEAADEMLEKLSDLLRLTLDRVGTQHVPLSDELDFVKKYLEIEKTRFGERLQVHFDVAPETLDALVPNLMLQPLVENALRHGIAPKIGGGRVDITAGRDGGTLRLEVRDNGVGMAPDTLDKFHGVGLGNTRSRLQHLYGSNHRFEVRAPSGVGLAVMMEIPFVSETAMPDVPSDSSAPGSPMESVA
jgi:LytS/YehU family sensor histidine kinase